MSMGNHSASSPHLSILEKSPLFSGLPQPILEEMLSVFHYKTYSKGLTISTEMLRAHFFIVLDGRIEVTRSNPNTGRSITLFLLGPGDGFDIITLLDGQPHDIEPTAMNDLQLLSAPIYTVRHWISAYPEFNQRFLPYLGSLLRSMEALTVDLALYDTASRLARLILRHTDTRRHIEQPLSPLPVGLIADLKHEALARMLGSVRQVVNKHLQTLRKEAVVHYSNDSLLVKDLRALKQQAGLALHRLENKHDLS